MGVALRIDALDIDDHILDKIESRHGVSLQDVEEACYSIERHIRRGRDGLYKLFSKTNSGGYLLVVLVDVGGGVWKVVTARPMTGTEKRLYRRQTGA